jgi:hypothetical protein
MFKLTCISLIALTGCITDSSLVAETTAIAQDVPKITQSSTNSFEASSDVLTLQSPQIVKHQNIELRLISVEDSRCATGVTCIWAGQMEVTIEVSNEDAEQKEVKLLRKREPEIVNVFGYTLSLLDVAPHPKKGKTILFSDQVVSLKITKTHTDT